MKFEKMVVGSILYDVHSYRMGNTTMRSMGCWHVEIVEMQEHGAMVKWNHNRPRYYTRRQLEKFREKAPEMETNAIGQQRIKRRPKKATEVSP